MAYTEVTKELPPSFAEIRSKYSYLQMIFQERNTEYQILRDIFHGTLAQDQRDKTVAGTVTRNRPEIIYNVLNSSIRRYMDQSSTPPRIDGVPRGFEIDDIELADKRAKLLDYICECNNMGVKDIQASFYQALLGKAIWNVRPAPHLKHKVKIELAVPDFYYPITKGDNWQDPVAVIYGFRQFKDDVWRDPMKFRQSGEMDSTIEYWDKKWYVRLDERGAMVIPHNLGEILWYETHNIPIPHQDRGQGDIDQSVGLQEYLNLLLSSFASMIAYAANPIAVVRGTKVGGTNLPFQERAVWELERDAQVGFLQWEGAPPTTEAQVLRIFQGIEDTTGVNSPAFGREIPSGTSGTTVRSLMAGFNTRLGTKQQLAGDCRARLLAGVQLVLEKMFPDEEFEVAGENVRPGRAYGKKTRYTVKPREFEGWYKTKIIYQPLDPAATYFQEMDKLKNGIQSEYTTMKNLGIQNVWDEKERIRIERQEKAEHQNDLALAQQGQYVSPEQQAQAAQDDQAGMTQLLEQLKGLKGVPGASPKGQEERDAKRDVALEAAKVPPPSVVSEPGGPSSPSALAEPELNLEDITSKLRASGFTGRIALSGKIATEGKGSGTVHLENPQQAGEVRQILGASAQGLQFQGLDPDKPLGADMIDLTRKGQKKNLAEPRKVDGYLNVIVTNAGATNTARVYEIAVHDDKGNLVQMGKTNPQRVVTAEQGELIRIRVSGISRRQDGDTVRWALVAPTPVKADAQARPSTLSEIEKLWKRGT